MCGRATLATPVDDLREVFGLDEVPSELPARFNIAPTQPIAIIRQPRKLEWMRWGLVLPDPRRPGPVINVRVETVARAPAYRESFRRRRCLIIVDGFYEWQRREKARQPFFVHRDDRKPFALAGIWTESTTADGELVDTCAILTGPAVGVVATLHDRMPLVVPREEQARWLNQAVEEDPAAITRLAGRAIEAFVDVPVSTLVNSPSNDDAHCIEAIVDEGPAQGTLGLT